MLIPRSPRPFVRYGIAVLAPLICIPFDQLLGLGILRETPFLLLFLAVLASAWYGGIGPGLLATTITIGVLLVFHFEPVDSLQIHPAYLSRLAIFIAAGFLISLMGAARLTAEQELRARQEELEKERSRMGDLVSSIPGVVWEAWGEPDAAIQHIDFVSEYVEQMLGYTREQWLSTPNFWLEIVHPDDRERAASEAAAIFASGKVGQSQFRWLARDGRTVWVEAHSMVVQDKSGRGVGMRGVTMDISVRKQAETSLRRWEQLFTHAGWGVATVDPESNRFIAVNPAFATMHGYSVEQMTDMPLAEIFAPEEREGISRNVAVVNERGHYLYESMHITRNGRRFPVLADVIVVRDESGRILYRAANFQDITERKLAEQELLAAMQAAEAANHAKNNFLAILSHELRTPLTPVFTAAHLLAESAALSHEDQELVAMIKHSVELESRLIDDLLELTRIDQGKLNLAVESVDLHEVIINALGFCQEEVSGNDQTLTLDLVADSSWIEGDAMRLQQVIWNLVKNASKFSKRGGSIELRTFNPSPGFIHIEVCDHGIGIEPEHLTRIFQPFEQAEQTITRVYGGLGLGLAITSAIVRLHGGTIAAHSDGIDQGATFSMQFPVALAVNDRAAAGAGLGDKGEQSYSALRILLVQSGERVDDAGLRGLLEDQGYHLHTADTDSAAISHVAASPVDIVIIDLDIPIAQAVELFERLREYSPLHGILVGAEEEAPVIERLQHAGIREYLVRPVSRNRLKRAIHKVVA